MGLLLAHKRTLSIYPDMVSVSLAGDANHSGGGKRGSIQVFSEDSRFRLFRLLHKLTFGRVTFCTLTYPAEFPTEAKVYKAHLKEYRRRFERLYGPVRGVWRLEFQKRGAPHFHIMYLDAPFIPLADWCALWSDVIHTDDANHRKIGVDIKLVVGGRESKLIAAYLAKYVAKVDKRTQKDVTGSPGRFWGRWNIPDAVPTVIDVFDYQAAEIVTRLLDDRKVKNWQPLDITLCSVLGESMGTSDFRRKVLDVSRQVLIITSVQVNLTTCNGIGTIREISIPV